MDMELLNELVDLSDTFEKAQVVAEGKKDEEELPNQTIHIKENGRKTNIIEVVQKILGSKVSHNQKAQKLKALTKLKKPKMRKSAKKF